MHVYVFTSLGVFKSPDALRLYIDPTYTEDGDMINSFFITETRLSNYNPMCIESEFFSSPVSLPHALGGFSYSDKWLIKIGTTSTIDSAILVYNPNIIVNTKISKLTFQGHFSF